MNAEDSKPLTRAERVYLQRLMVYLTDNKALWVEHGRDKRLMVLCFEKQCVNLRMFLRHDTVTGRVMIIDGSVDTNNVIADVLPGAGGTDLFGCSYLKSWIVERWPLEAYDERLIYNFVTGIDPLQSMAAVER
jgi:hypothetical protein